MRHLFLAIAITVFVGCSKASDFSVVVDNVTVTGVVTGDADVATEKARVETALKLAK